LPRAFDDQGWIRDHGGISERSEQTKRGYIESVRVSSQEMIRRGLLSFETAPRLTYVPFEVVKNEQRNAFAMIGRGSDQYRIVFYDGLVFGMLNDLIAACQHPEFQSWLPRGQSAVDCSAMLSLISREFLLWHELAHIINGHLDLCSASNLGFIIAEADGEKHNLMKAMDLQAFEINADSTAAIVAFKSLVTWHLNVRDQALPDDVQNKDSLIAFYGDLSLAMRLFFFAIARIFLILGPKISDPERLEMLSHPPAFLRIASIAQQASVLLTRDYPGLLNEPLLDLSAEAYARANKCLASPETGFGSPSHLEWLLDNRVGNHLNRVVSHLQRIGPEMEKYKLGGKPRDWSSR
jgi:hypothetical protein